MTSMASNMTSVTSRGQASLFHWKMRLFWRIFIQHDLESVVNNFILTLRRQNVIPIGAKLDETERRRRRSITYFSYTLWPKFQFRSKHILFSIQCFYFSGMNSKNEKWRVFYWTKNWILLQCVTVGQEVKKDIITKYGSPSINLIVHFDYDFLDYKMTLNFTQKRLLLGRKKVRNLPFFSHAHRIVQ